MPRQIDWQGPNCPGVHDFMYPWILYNDIHIGTLRLLPVSILAL